MNERTIGSATHDRARRLDRRGFLSFIAASAGTAILAACGGSVSPTATAGSGQTATGNPTTAPTLAPTTAATGGVSPTTAPPTTTSPTAASVAVAPTMAPVAVGAAGGQVSMWWTKPSTLHPLFSTAGSEQQVERLMFGALVKMTDKLQPVPDLAEKIVVAPDARTYTFTLKQGLKFTDGMPLTAKDVVFTFERAIDKKTGSYWRGRLLGIMGAADYGDGKTPTIAGLETPDDTTVKVTLANPDATWQLTIGDFAGMGILPSHLFKDIAPDQLAKQAFALAPNVSAGVFQFASYAPDQYLEIKRNEAYAGGPKAKLDRIFLKILTQDVGIAQLEKGELDLMGPISVGELERLRKNASLTVVSVPAPSVSSLVFNLERPFFKDKRIRQAFHYALDREAVVKEIFKGEAQIINSTIIGPDWIAMPGGLNPYKYDPTKAKQLLKDANWDATRKIGLMYTPGNKETDAFLPVAQQQFKDIGVMVDLTPADTVEYNRRYTQSGEFDMTLSGGGVYREDPDVSAKYYETGNFIPAGGNSAHFSNPRADELFKMGRATTDLTQRTRIYTELAQLLNDDPARVLLWSPNSIFAVNKRLVGFKPPSYIQNQVWNADEWTVTK